MTEKDALNLTQNYITGWKHNDLALITSTLDSSCVIIESHGPTYHGIDKVALWFEYWLAANGQIRKWEMLSFTFCEQKQTAFVEWDFDCNVDGEEHAFQGISVIKFSQMKILHVHEYRMTYKTGASIL